MRSLILLAMTPLISATCYYRDGTIAENDVPCPNSNICCPSGDTCMDNNICRDKNNFANGSTVTFSPGHTYNYTGLYYTSSCQSKSYNDCYIQCTTYGSSSGQYIWACNSELTSYCCHLDSIGLGQFDCCSNGTFALPSPVALIDKQSTTSASASSMTTTATTSTNMVTTTTTLSRTSSVAPASGAPVTSGGLTDETIPSGSSLSKGAKIGLGVGIAAAAILAIVLVVVLVRLQRQKRANMTSKYVSEMPAHPEIEGRREGLPPSELGSEPPKRVYELAP